MPSVRSPRESIRVFLLCRLVTVGTLLAISGVADAEVIVAFTEPYRTVALVSSESGNLESLKAQVGDRVSTDQVLGSLDCEVLRAQRKIAIAKAEATGEILAAKAELKVRENLYKRYEALRKESNEASELEVERKRADFEIQQAKVRTVEDLMSLHRLEVDLLDAQIRKRELISPIDGVISAVDFDTGDFVAPGQAKAIVTIVDIDQLRANFHVPNQLAVQLAVGEIVRLRFPEPPQSVDGKIESISPVTDPRTGTVPVRIVIPNSNHAIRSGWRCEFLSTNRERP